MILNYIHDVKACNRFGRHTLQKLLELYFDIYFLKESDSVNLKDKKEVRCFYHINQI